MAEGVLGLGGGQGASLNQELIDKLKGAERKAQVDPIEKNLETWDKEKEVFGEIKTLVDELLDSIKPFDLFVVGGTDAFEQKAASTSGDSVIFNAPDASKLNNGVTSVNVTQLAQKDVFQSNAFNTATKDSTIDAGDLNITVNGNTTTIDTTGMTYSELVDDINNKYEGMSASLEQVGDDSYRLVLKSSNTGLDNALTITGAASQALGYTSDGTTENSANHILSAQNLQATVDGVAYDVSSNVITVDGGLEITAIKQGESSININDDKAQISSQVNTFIEKYNQFVSKINDELSDENTPISDKSSLRGLLSDIKSMVFSEYGKSGDESLFNYGFEVDKNGQLSLDSTKFQEAIDNNFDGLKDLFIGTAEKKGLGTTLKEYLSDVTLSTGILGRYDDYLDTRKKTLTEDKEKAEEKLDSKYTQLSLQFAEYGAIIDQMEREFSGLKLMIQQSTS